jgi:hypothetical protein
MKDDDLLNSLLAIALAAAGYWLLVILLVGLLVVLR